MDCFHFYQHVEKARCAHNPNEEKNNSRLSNF